MSKNTSFSLSVVRVDRCHLEKQEEKLSALRAALDEGKASGQATPFDFERFIARKRKA